MTRICRIRKPAGRPAQAGGFTLLELLLAMGLGSMLAVALLQLLLADGHGMQRLGRLLRERSHLRRSLELVRGDVLRAAAVSAAPEQEVHACPLAGRRPVLHLAMAEGPAVTYSVGAAPSPIWRGQVLMRCGPAFGLDGQPSADGAAQNRVVLDGLARPEQAWTGCAALLASEGEGAAWLNGSAQEALAACRTADGELVGLRLHLQLEAGGGRRQRLSLEAAAARG